MRRTSPGREKAQCVKCFNRRSLKRVNGPGIAKEGLLMCRQCTQAYKMLLKLREQQAKGQAARVVEEARKLKGKL